VFARSGHSCTLVNILLTRGACIPWWTGTSPLSCCRVGVTPSSWVAGVPQTLILQVAQKTCLSKRTLALISTNLIMAGTPIKARTPCAVIFVLFAILSNKPVDTNTLVSTLCILTGSMVLAGIVQTALINIIQAVTPRPVWRTLAGIGVNTVHTPTAILAQISSTVIDIFLAVMALESIRAGAIVLIFPSLSAQSTIFTG